MLRFAPSPTGDLDLESLRIALFNHILSKQLNEELIVRIEDSNRQKNIEGKEKEILELLSLFSIDYSRVVYQSENIKYHTQMAMKLLLDKKAFNCFCSDEALKQDKEKAKKEGKPYSYSGFCQTISDETKFNCNAPFVVRLSQPSQNIKFTDAIKGECEYQPYEVDSCIILRHDKTPTENFASAMDDMLFNTSTIIRKENNILNTPKQIHIRESLGYTETIKYYHIPQITFNKEDKKITVQSLIDKGYLPVAIANYLLLLGFETPKEIFSIEEVLEWFDITKISKSPAKFDLEKLNEINCKYMKMLDDMRFSKIIGFADDDIGKLAKLYIGDAYTTLKIKKKIENIFSQKKPLKGFETEFKTIKECLKDAPFIKEFEELQEYVSKKTELTDEKLLTPLCFLLTGEKKEPKLSEIYALTRNYLGEIIK